MLIYDLNGSAADLRQLRADTEQRGWDGEVKRHPRVISELEHHCSRLETRSSSPDRLDKITMAG